MTFPQVEDSKAHARATLSKGIRVKIIEGKKLCRIVSVPHSLPGNSVIWIVFYITAVNGGAYLNNRRKSEDILRKLNGSLCLIVEHNEMSVPPSQESH